LPSQVLAIRFMFRHAGQEVLILNKGISDAGPLFVPHRRPLVQRRM
jgi:hypothetical protein